MAATDIREHERIDLKLRTRLWLDEMHRGKPVIFEGYSRTRNLSIGGMFLESTYLLPVGFPINLEVELEEGAEILSVRGKIAHTEDDDTGHATGMGVMFTALDSDNRERLLRFFVSDRIRDFYDTRFTTQFPHLRDLLSLRDVALILNLWEDREGRVEGLAAGEFSTPDAPKTEKTENQRPVARARSTSGRAVRRSSRSSAKK